MEHDDHPPSNPASLVLMTVLLVLRSVPNVAGTSTMA